MSTSATFNSISRGKPSEDNASSCQGQNPHSAPHAELVDPAFTCFDELPPELRRMIWKLTFPVNRVVHVQSESDLEPTNGKPEYTCTLGSNIIHPVALSTCFESREIALESYRPLLLPGNKCLYKQAKLTMCGYQNILVNWELDTLHYGPFGYVNDLAKIVEVEKCKHLVLEIDELYEDLLFVNPNKTDWAWKTSLRTRMLPSLLTSLQSVRFVMMAGHMPEPQPRRARWWAEQTQYKFIDNTHELRVLVHHLHETDTRTERRLSSPTSLQPMLGNFQELDRVQQWYEKYAASQFGKHLKHVDFTTGFHIEKIVGFRNVATGWELFYPGEVDENDLRRAGWLGEELEATWSRRRICEADGSLINRYQGVEEMFRDAEY